MRSRVSDFLRVLGVLWVLLISVGVAGAIEPTVTTEAVASEPQTVTVSDPLVPLFATSTSQPPTVTNERQSWRITAVGDIMVHETQLKTHWDAVAKQYLFDDDFLHIRPFLASADLVIGNLETTLGGPGRKYSGYPLFNTPDTLAEALKRAGFHILMTANNHCLDTGVAGLKRTHSILSGLGFGVIGTRPAEKTESFLVRDVCGLKVGLAAYTYETSRKQGQSTLNGGLMPSGAAPLIDSFATETLASNLASMSVRIRTLRSRGAELIVFVMHWGVEYGSQPMPQQRQIAAHLASEGVDIIFGSHPHVVQPVSWVESPDGRRKTLVVWSHGNFISNQRYEFLKRHDTEDGLMVSVTIERSASGEPPHIARVTYEPLWVHRHHKGGRWRYHVLPLLSALPSPEAYGLEPNPNLIRARNSLKRTMKTLAGSPEWQAPDWTETIKSQPVVIKPEKLITDSAPRPEEPEEDEENE